MEIELQHWIPIEAISDKLAWSYQGLIGLPRITQIYYEPAISECLWIQKHRHLLGDISSHATTKMRKPSTMAAFFAQYGG